MDSPGGAGVGSWVAEGRQVDIDRRAKTRAEDIGVGEGEGAASVRTSLWVGDALQFVRSAALQAKRGRSTCSKCWHCTTSFLKVSWSGNVGTRFSWYRTLSLQ